MSAIIPVIVGGSLVTAGAAGVIGAIAAGTAVASVLTTMAEGLVGWMSVQYPVNAWIVKNIAVSSVPGQVADTVTMYKGLAALREKLGQQVDAVVANTGQVQTAAFAMFQNLKLIDKSELLDVENLTLANTIKQVLQSLHWANHAYNSPLYKEAEKFSDWIESKLKLPLIRNLVGTNNSWKPLIDAVNRVNENLQLFQNLNYNDELILVAEKINLISTYILNEYTGLPLDVMEPAAWIVTGTVMKMLHLVGANYLRAACADFFRKHPDQLDDLYPRTRDNWPVDIEDLRIPDPPDKTPLGRDAAPCTVWRMVVFIDQIATATYILLKMIQNSKQQRKISGTLYVFGRNGSDFPGCAIAGLSEASEFEVHAELVRLAQKLVEESQTDYERVYGFSIGHDEAIDLCLDLKSPTKDEIPAGEREPIWQEFYYEIDIWF